MTFREFLAFFIWIKARWIASIKERAPEGFGVSDFLIDLIGIGRERCEKFRPLTELDQEKFIACIGSLEKRGGGGRGLANLVAHAAAGIKHQTHRERRIILREIGDLLLNAVFKYPKIGCGQIRHVGAGCRYRMDRHQNQRSIHAEMLTGNCVGIESAGWSGRGTIETTGPLDGV